MTEAYLYAVNQKLRLLARRHIKEDSYGTILRGQIDQRIERVRQAVLALLDQELDGHPLNGLQLNFVRRCERITQRFQPQVRQLELAYLPLHEGIYRSNSRP